MSHQTSLPLFDQDGLLPPGDYVLTLEQLRESILVRPVTGSLENWDQDWRMWLTLNLEILVTQLWAVGIERIYIDGSFVEDKTHPNDIDGYFECKLSHLASGNLQQELNSLDTYKVWTWDPKSRMVHPDSPKKQLPMWHRYRVELYPHHGQSSGIRDQFGQELQFPSAFRLSRREHKQKGIILLAKSGEHQ
ncbi:MAG: hypothetical protein HY711_08185 [Candidatus Melainabacteria bacterium]|nr:hypothetical protein [Candidatus Melainabacteria bacterium]